MTGIMKRIRGAIGNSMVWATGWVVAGLGLMAGIYPFSGLSEVLPFWEFFREFAPWFAASLGTMGFLAGTAFSAYLIGAARDKELDDLSPWRFALRGALISGVLAPAVGLGILLVTGSGVVMGEMAFVSAVAAGLGGATALATIKIAQRALTGGHDAAGAFPSYPSSGTT